MMCAISIVIARNSKFVPLQWRCFVDNVSLVTVLQQFVGYSAAAGGHGQGDVRLK